MASRVEGKRIWKVGAMALVTVLTLSIGHAMSVLPRGSFLVMFGMGSTSATLPYGSTAVLSPVFADGTGVIKDGGNTTVVASAESGSTYPVGPLTSGQTYTLTVSNTASDFVTATVTVMITPPSVAAISPADPTVTVGNTKAFSSSVSGAVNAGITWSVDGVTGGNGTVGTISAGGLYTAPASPGSHTIRATAQADGSTYASTTVTVVAAPVAGGLVATKGTITTGGSTTVTPSFSGGTGKIGTSGAGSSDLAASATSGSGVSTGNLAGSRTYTLTVTNAAGDTSTASCTVTVVAAPVATSLVASTASPLYGGTFTLTPTYSGGTGAIDNGVTCPGTGVASGAVTANWGGARVYTLTVTNAAGDSVMATTTVTPQTVAVAAVSPANPTRTVNTAGVVFTSSVSGAANTGITWSVSAGTITGGQGTNSMTWTAPATAQSVTITATSQADGTKSASTTVTVVAAPVATSLAASTASPLYGGTFTLTPTYSGGTGAINNGVTCPATGVASSAVTANWSGARTYTLTVTNAAGSTATATRVVTPQTVAVAAVNPANPTRTVNTAGVVFTSSVSGAANTGITWSVSAGTITGGQGTNSMTWTAPATAQSVTITATSQADGTKSASTTVTVWGAPSIGSFTASPTTVNSGQSSTLYPVFSAPGGSASINNSIGVVTSGGNYSTGALAASRTYTLTVVNGAGDSATANATVTVNTLPGPVMEYLTPVWDDCDHLVWLQMTGVWDSFIVIIESGGGVSPPCVRDGAVNMTVNTPGTFYNGPICGISDSLSEGAYLRIRLTRNGQTQDFVAIVGFLPC